MAKRRGTSDNNLSDEPSSSLRKSYIHTLIQDAPTVATFVAAGFGAWWFGAPEALLSVADSFLSPLFGSLANNLHAQGVALVVEAGLAALAQKGLTWNIRQLRKVDTLEKANKDLAAQIEALKEKEKALEQKKVALEAKEKKLNTKEGSLNKKAKTLSERQTAITAATKEINATKEALKREQAALELAQEALKAAQKEHQQAKQKVAHEAAKAVKDRERRVAALEKEIAQRETAMDDKQRAADDLRNELEKQREELNEAEQDFLLQKQVFEKEKAAFEAEKASVAPQDFVVNVATNPRPSLLASFKRAKEQQGGLTLALSPPASPMASDKEEGYSEEQSHGSPSSHSQEKLPSRRTRQTH